MSDIKVIQIGLGPIGQKVVRYIQERKGARIVAAVDLDPAKVGRDAGEVCGLDRKLGVIVSDRLSAALKKCTPDVAVVCTASSLKKSAPCILEVVARKIPVVSTCEELSFPWQTAPALARQLDEAARRSRVAILGTGVNPGFLMDFLPLAMTGVCRRVDAIRVSRIQDASIRRIPFQQKIGAALTLKEFEAKHLEGTLRHVGLTESMHMIASSLGWKLTKTEDCLSPIVARKAIKTGYKPIRAGMAAGVQQIGRGWVGKRQVITLVFRAAIGEPHAADTIEIQGDPCLKSVIHGGVNGDVATCAITTNAIAAILKAQPGLRTMADIAPVTPWF